MVHRKIAVIGIGQFGESIAKNLSKKGAEVLAIDKLQENIERVSDDVSLAVAIDATDKKALLSQNILEFDAVVVAIGESFEQRLLCVALLLDLGVKRIIARCGGKSQRIILEKLGVKELWSPEEEVGAIVAERLLNPSVMSYLQLPDDYRIVEMLTPKKVVGRSIQDLNFRDRYKLSLVTIKKEENVTVNNMVTSVYHVVGVPGTDYVINSTDRLLLFGKNKDIDRFIEINE
ncbi:MAG TPA: potassium transporter KtrA [Bacteroidales bacterium]|jgi:trk system potassium uptake protein TrkA|nr:potassium transporter KtrA [Bacteroidales bacterium]